MKKILKKAYKEGHERYPYAGTFAGELFGMTPDDYRLDGWRDAVPYTVEATLQHVKSTLETNVKKCNAGEVYGAVYGAGYHKAVNDVISLVDNMLNSLKKEHENATKMD